jgi:2',3'-cyclic-nucleotide 2'-phosphodiesterase/3'-nucleotidase
MPWDYTKNKEDRSGSTVQLAMAVSGFRADSTLLVDAGDLIQGNFSEIFVHRKKLHPMVRALNRMQYDVWVTGNHDYNYGMDVLGLTVKTLDAAVLTGNVYDKSGAPVADGCKIFEKDGVRIAVIGMVTPNIARWDKSNLQGYTVTDPLTEIRKILHAIKGKYDVLVGVFHMGIENEYGVPNSGVTDICNACPEFDVVISSHEHRQIESMDINGVLVVQNKQMAQTLSVINLFIEAKDAGWKLTGKTAKSVSGYAPDPELMKLLEKDHCAARKEAAKEIGVLTGGPLIPENVQEPIRSLTQLPAGQVQDTALVELINRAQMNYSGARVSAAPLCGPDASLPEGKIRQYDVARIYSFNNTLYTVRMNGRQLKKLMEWSAGYFAPMDPESPKITANPDFPPYNYLMFDGVRYEIDLVRPVGDRIRNLAWPDGTPVREDETFVLALNNYNANSHVLTPGEIYTKDDLPVLAEIDVRGDLGGIRELIRDYIIRVRNGKLRPECDYNWRIVIPDINNK